MDIKISDLVRETGGQILGPLNENEPVRRVSTDTRLTEKGDIFFAFPGSRFDGHDFIAQAIEKGVRNFVVSDLSRIPPEAMKKATMIRVGDTVRAYGDLARFYRQQFKIPAVAITGSSGKTTVKELTAHLLSSKFKVLKNRGTENNLIGVPKTMFQLDPSHEVLVLEMGTNQPGEIERLSSLIAPQVGMVTLIGVSHLEGLKSTEGVREEKLKILKNLSRGGQLILNGEDPFLKEVQSGVHQIRRVGFSKEGTGLFAENSRLGEHGTSFLLNGTDFFETQLSGRHNLINCLMALQGAMSFQVSLPALQKSLKEFKPVPGRLCPRVMDGIVFLDDSYNSNPSSFAAGLETLKSMKARGKKGVVCGDMLELGTESEAWHRRMGKLLGDLSFDFVVATGPECKFLVEEALGSGYHQAKIFHTDDSAQAGLLVRRLAGAGDLVLVKGSRGMQMEKVFECFINCSIP